MKPKHLRFRIFPLVAASMIASIANAQVTIGSEDKPKTGVLLDLKQYSDNEATAGGRNADKGLGMPRMKLTQLNNLSDLGLELTDNESHVGLLIYNINQCLDYGMSNTKGLYVWDGNMWQKSGKKILHLMSISTLTIVTLPPPKYIFTDNSEKPEHGCLKICVQKHINREEHLLN